MNGYADVMSDKNIVGSFREIVQDLLVPELKAVKVEVAALRNDMKVANESLRTEMKLSHDALREEVKLRHDTLEGIIKHGDQRNEQLILALSEKLDFAIDIRERLASIEARMPRQ